MDIWSSTSTHVDILLPGSQASPSNPVRDRDDHHLHAIHAKGYSSRPFVASVEDALINASRSEPYVRAGDVGERGSIPLTDPFHSAYRSLDDQHAFLADLARVYPWLATVLDLGVSPEGRPIKGLRIGEAPSEEGKRKKEIVFISGQHAREWIGPSTAIYFAHWLLENARSRDVRPLLRNLDLTIIPNLNVVRFVPCSFPFRFSISGLLLLTLRRCFGCRTATNTCVATSRFFLALDLVGCSS